MVLIKYGHNMKYPRFNTWNDSYNTTTNIGFLHIPKTAGRTIGMALMYNYPEINRFKHSTVTYVESLSPDLFIDSFIFCVVRNPYERFYSACIHNIPNESFELLSSRILSDPEWCLSYTNMGHHEHFFSQMTYIIDDTGLIRVDYIGRFEDLQNVIDTLAIDHDVDLRKVFKYKEPISSDWREVLTEKTKRNIEKIYAEDFKQLNYKMEV